MASTDGGFRQQGDALIEMAAEVPRQLAGWDADGVSWSCNDLSWAAQARSISVGWLHFMS